MKTRNLFGIKFVNSPHYKNQILADFKNWKKTRQEALDFQDKQIQFFIHRHMKLLEAPSCDKESRTFEDRHEQLIREIRRDVALKGWNQLFETELQDPIRRRHCNITYEEAQDLLIHKDCDHFLIANTVINECKKIQVTEPLDLEWLEPTPDGKRQLNFGEHFIRYQKKGSKIVALAACFTPRQEQDYMLHTFFHFDLAAKTETLILLDEEQASFYDRIAPRGFDKESHTLLFQLIAFMELAPKEHIYLPPQQKYDDVVANVRVKNGENFPMTYVKMSWNTKVHYGTIPVKLHLKKQPCGPGNTERKRILILNHTRDGYNLKVQKIMEAQAQP